MNLRWLPGSGWVGKLSRWGVIRSAVHTAVRTQVTTTFRVPRTPQRRYPPARAAPTANWQSAAQSVRAGNAHCARAHRRLLDQGSNTASRSRAGQSARPGAGLALGGSHLRGETPPAGGATGKAEPGRRAEGGTKLGTWGLVPSTHPPPQRNLVVTGWDSPDDQERQVRQR